MDLYRNRFLQEWKADKLIRRSHFVWCSLYVFTCLIDALFISAAISPDRSFDYSTEAHKFFIAVS